MRFTQHPQPEINVNAPLIYLWEIKNAEGEVMGRYVGKAEGGAKRPTEDYVYNVDRRLNGEPYRTKGRDYRRVHMAMADAMRSGHTISLRYLCNVSPEQDINAVEQHYIQEYGCLTNNIGLNGRRPDHGVHSVSITQGTEMKAQKKTTGTLGTTTTEKSGLEAFRQLIKTHYPQLRPKPGKNRYAFEAHDGVRIVRVEQQAEGGRVNIKLSLTSRREGVDRSFNWDGTEKQALNAVAGELNIYEQHFKKP